LCAGSESFVCDDGDFDHHSPDRMGGDDDSDDGSDGGGGGGFRGGFGTYKVRGGGDDSDEDSDEDGFVNEFSAPMRPQELNRFAFELSSDEDME
jgi:hypothetical protein